MYIHRLFWLAFLITFYKLQHREFVSKGVNVQWQRHAVDRVLHWHAENELRNLIYVVNFKLLSREMGESTVLTKVLCFVMCTHMC